MLVAAIEIGLAVIGIGLLAFGIYGIWKNKFCATTLTEVAQIKVTFPLAMWIALSGLSSLGFSGYLASAGITANPVSMPATAATTTSGGGGSSTSSSSSAGVGSEMTASPIPKVPVSSPTPVTPNPTPTASATSTTATPTVTLDAPRTGTKVSVSKGFAVSGTNSPLGSDTIWILDYNGGSSYTVDEAATVINGKWTAFNGPGLGTGPLPFPLIMAVILADPACNTMLNRYDGPSNYDMSSLPSECKIASEIEVDVSRT